MAKLKCPKCKGTHIQLFSDDINTKLHTRTALDLNPLRPFTLFNHKTVKKGDISLLKILLGASTGGWSLMFTGIRKKAHNEYYCMDCGNRWIGR